MEKSPYKIKKTLLELHIFPQCICEESDCLTCFTNKGNCDRNLSVHVKMFPPPDSMGWSSETAWSFRHTPTVRRNLNFTTWLCLQPGDLLSPLADNYEQKSLQALWTMCERQAFEQNKHKGNNNVAFTNARCVELSLWWMEITFKSLCKILHTGRMCVLKYSCKMIRVDPFFDNKTPSFFNAFNTTMI